MQKRKKKRPVLTIAYFTVVENLRMALEVLTGVRVRIDAADFNREGAVVDFTTAGKVTHVFFEVDGFTLYFQLEEQWYQARFEDQWKLVRVAHRDYDDLQQHRKKGHALWWEGCSYLERWETPMFPAVVDLEKPEHMTVQEYLNS